MKKQYIENLNTKNDLVDDKYAVKEKRSPRSYKFGTMFTLIVADRTGERMLNYFGGENGETTQSLYSSFDTQDIVEIKGKVDVYNGTVSISINPDTGSIKKTDDYDISDFLPTTKKDVEQMKSELKIIISKIENPFMKKLLESLFNDDTFMTKYANSPAASFNHHNFVGGLLEHVLNMIKISTQIVELYPKLNKDLLVTGCILHDIGKINELKMGTVIEYTNEGHLLGHIAMGAQIVSDVMNKLDSFPDILKQKILHMILSHHGSKDKGSPVEPLLPEAVILHQVDYCDSRIQKIMQEIESTSENDEWVRTRGWPTIFLK